MDRDLSEYNRSKFNNSKLMHHRRHTSLRRLIRATLNHQRGTLDAPVQLIVRVQTATDNRLASVH